MASLLNPGFSSLPPETQRRVLYLRCLEETDGSATVIPLELRTAASRAADKETTDAAFLTTRAATLAAGLPATWQGKLSAATNKPDHPWLRWLPAALCVSAFLIGWFTNELGPSRTINVLSFPILGLILWNLAVAIFSLVAHWKRKPVATRTTVPSGATPEERTDALFTSRWKSLQHLHLRAGFPLWLHLAAICLATGIIAGMYSRGLTRAYSVTWESTFLAEPHVRALTRIFLGPASLVTGIPVPDPSRGSAAPWIHLWATTAALFIIIPRILLANMARSTRRETLARIDEDWHRETERCRRTSNPTPAVADIFPVHMDPASPARDAIRTIARHLWGPEVLAHFHPSIAYGNEEDASFPASSNPAHRILLFSFAATPEQDLHGTIAAHAATPPSPHCLAILDASSFEDRFAALPEYRNRTASRLAAWRKVLPPALPILMLDSHARQSPAEAARSLAATP